MQIDNLIVLIRMHAMFDASSTQCGSWTLQPPAGLLQATHLSRIVYQEMEGTRAFFVTTGHLAPGSLNPHTHSQVHCLPSTATGCTFTWQATATTG